jgi:hypothetical protein
MAARDDSAKISSVSSAAAENCDCSVGENGESIRAAAKWNHDQVVEITEVAAAASPTATHTAAEETIAPTVTEELSADEDGAAGEVPAQQVPSVMHVVRMVGNKVLRLVAPLTCKGHGTTNMPVDELHHRRGNPTLCSRWLQ